MTLPKRGSRNIKVDGVQYRWRVRRRATYGQMLAETELNLAFGLPEGNGPDCVVNIGTHPSNVRGLYGHAVTPRIVAWHIRTALQNGWQPNQPGPQFRVDGCQTQHHSPDRAYPRDAMPLADDPLISMGECQTDRDTFHLRETYYVNDRPLIAIVKEAEEPIVREEVATRIRNGEELASDTDYAGQYSECPVDQGEYLLGTNSNFAFGASEPAESKATLFGCTCGILDCWFLLVRITIGDNVVIWSDFEQFHRNWIYPLGPFVFDRQDYERQVQAKPVCE